MKVEMTTSQVSRIIESLEAHRHNLNAAISVFESSMPETVQQLKQRLAQVENDSAALKAARDRNVHIVK